MCEAAAARPLAASGNPATPSRERGRHFARHIRRKRWWTWCRGGASSPTVDGDRSTAMRCEGEGRAKEAGVPIGHARARDTVEVSPSRIIRSYIRPHVGGVELASRVKPNMYCNVEQELWSISRHRHILLLCFCEPGCRISQAAQRCGKKMGWNGLVKGPFQNKNGKHIDYSEYIRTRRRRLHGVHSSPDCFSRRGADIVHMPRTDTRLIRSCLFSVVVCRIAFLLYMLVYGRSCMAQCCNGTHS